MLTLLHKPEHTQLLKICSISCQFKTIIIQYWSYNLLKDLESCFVGFPEYRMKNKGILIGIKTPGKSR